MKRLLFVLLAGLCAAAIGSEIDLKKPVPVIRLQDGRVMKNAVFSKFGPSVVTIKSNLGTLGIRYEFLPDDIRAAAEKQRAGGAKWFPGDTSGNTEKIEGQIFIQTAGASSYKFGNVEVYAFDLAALSNFELAQGKPVYLPRPIHTTTTDADGKFLLKVPMDRPYFIFAQAKRLSADATYTERYEWRAPMNAVRAGKLLMLSTDFRFPASTVTIERTD